MNPFKNYDTWCKTIGKFDIYCDEYDDINNPFNWADPEFEDRAFVKLTFNGDDEANRRTAYAALTNIAHLYQKSGCKPENHCTIVEISTQFRNRHPIMGSPVTEYGIVLYARLSDLTKLIEAEDATFQAQTITGEILPDFTKMRVSLSCAYKEQGSKFVKVRFGGYSVNYYFNNKKWHRSKTQKELLESFSESKTKLIMSVLERPEILERATGKATNESGIGESSPIALHLLLPIKEGWKLAGENKAINNPNVKPAFLLCENDSYGHNYLVDSDNEIYNVKSFRMKRGQNDWEVGPETYDQEYFHQSEKNVKILKCAVRRADIDDYTKKRIERAIKRKL